MYHLVRHLLLSNYNRDLARIFGMGLFAILLNLSLINYNSISDESEKEPEQSQQANQSLYNGLIRALDDPNPTVRAIAINNLAELNYEPALPKIVGFIGAENIYTKTAATNAVTVMNQLTPEVASLIIENLSNKDSRIRYSSARALSQYKNLNDKQIPQIIELLSDKDYKARMAAVIIIKNNAEVSAKQIPQILELMKNENPEVRAASVSALGKLGTSGQKNINAILPLLSDADPNVRTNATLAIGDFGAAAAGHANDVE